MSKKKDPIKPIFPLKHEFVDSLTHLLHEAGMLMTTVETLIEHPTLVRQQKGLDMLKERAAALRLAMYGDES